MTLVGIRACVFDAYGTLLDVHSAVRQHATGLGARGAELSALWRQRQLEYTWLRTLMGAYVDFERVTADALDYALAAHGIADPRLRQALLQAYRRLEPYPEVPAMLDALKAKGMATAILSNGAPEMLADGLVAAGLDRQLDAVLSVDGLRIYKPRHEVYALATEQFGVPPKAICFVSSNGWDAHGGALFGFQVVWVNRLGAPAERLPGVPAAVLPDLGGLPGLLF